MKPKFQPFDEDRTNKRKRASARDFEGENERQQDVYRSVSENYLYILKYLIKQDDFRTFSTVLAYLESKAFFIIEEKNDESNQVRNQIECEILGLLMEEMKDIREDCHVSGRGGKRKDLLSVFYKTRKVLVKWEGMVAEERYDLRFQRILKKDINSLIKGIEKRDQCI